MESKKTFELPIAVISPTDVARLLRELENLDEYFRQAAIRTGGTPQSAPRYSRLLDEVVIANNLNLLQENDRQWLISAFKGLETSAPIMHVSFSVDPPGPYVQKIVNWFRQNIRGDVLVRVGLQPNIGAGCVVRTTNKSFDFSLRRFFDSKHDFFMKRLHEVVKPELDDDVFEPKLEAEKPPEEPETELTAMRQETVPEEAAAQKNLEQKIKEPTTEVTA
jgi:hypothetical protein